MADRSGSNHNWGMAPPSISHCRRKIMKTKELRQIEILLVEDSPADILLTREAFKEFKIVNALHVVEDGVEALLFLNQDGKYAAVPRPDLILLDLNLPRKGG